MAQVTTPLFGGDNSSLSATGAVYNRINAAFPSSWTGTESYRASIVSSAFTLSNFHLQIDTAPGTGSGFTFTIMKNGVATSLTLTISDTATSGSDILNSVSFIAGDTISIQCTPASGTPTTPGNEWWNLSVTTSDTTAPIFSGFGSPSTNITAYGGLTAGGQSSTAWSATETDMQIIVPTSGTFTNLYAFLSNAPGTGNAREFTLIKNGVATTLDVSISGTGTTAGDTTHSISVVAGDTLTVRTIPTGTPATSYGISVTCTFTPTNPGETFVGFGSANVPSATTTDYEQILGIGNDSWTTSEAKRILMPGAVTFTALYIKLDTAPGTSGSRTFTLRESSGNTSLTTTLTGTTTTASSTATVNYSQGQSMTFQSDITGTPTAATGGVHAGFLLYSPPPAAAFTPIVIVY